MKSPGFGRPQMESEKVPVLCVPCTWSMMAVFMRHTAAIWNTDLRTCLLSVGLRCSKPVHIQECTYTLGTK